MIKNNAVKIFSAMAMALCILFTSCAMDTPTTQQPTPNDTTENTTNTNPFNDTVTMLNVGQASCALIESEGKFGVIDVGFQDGETDIITYFNERGVETIEVIVLTHFHFDHTSEMLDILRNFNVKNVVIPDLSQENTPTHSFYQALLEKAEKGKYDLHFAHEGLEFTIGDGTLRVISDTNNSAGINNTSVITTYTNGDSVYLNTGDAERETEKLIFDKIPTDVDFFTAGHHGSSDANGYKFLERMNPSLIGISCGRNNEYGHPHDKTLNRINDLQIPYVITYESGEIVYSMTDKAII